MITVEMWSDIICPWCQIGRRRFQQAIAQRPELQVEIVWRAFQLHPGWPAEGLSWAQFTTARWGSPAAARPIFDRVERTAERDGLHFDFTRIPRVPNTADAHRLILYAQRAGRLWPTVEALASGYFSGTSDLTRRGELARLGARAGAGSALELEALLERGELTADVAADQVVATRAQIRGVPFFVLEGQLALSGAQPVEVVLQALDRVARLRAA